MLFSLVTTLFAFFGLSAAAALETRQLSVCEPGHPTWCSTQECFDKNPGCHSCASVGKDYTENCGDNDAWVCADTC
ncbi:hypothetical protein FB107DRAFT_279511 [Schizophyllum commune]